MFRKSPAFYAHALNGILLVTSLIIILLNLSKIKQLEIYKQTMLLLMFTLVVGVHGLSHLGLEQVYGYNPLKMM
jgi:hypothetical protein